MEEDNDDNIYLLIEGEQLVCSKRLLLYHSEYFRALLEGNFIERNTKYVTLKDVEAKSMRDLYILLSDRSHLNRCQDIYGVLLTCSMLLFDELKKYIILEIRRVLTPTNSLEVWSIMEKINITELHWKAKSISLQMFHHVKRNGTITILSLSEVCNYLGHINLQCDRELSVFQCAMHWFRENYRDENFSESTILKMLLKCIAFKSVNIDEIPEMTKCKEIEKHPDILKILNYICNLKCGNEYFPNEDYEIYNMAVSLMNSKVRYLPKAPCLLVRKAGVNVPVCDSEFDIQCYGPTSRIPKEIGRIKFVEKSLMGFVIHNYLSRLYLIGGEYSLGKGSWNREVRSFDLVSGIIQQNQSIPSPRRHFESCHCGDICYIVGGTGTFRLIQDNMYWYNFKSDTWSVKIDLPCSGRQLKCCSIEEKLLIISFNNNCGYIYQNDVDFFYELAIYDPHELLPQASPYLNLFVYKDKVYLKGGCLIEMEIKNSKIYVLKNLLRSKYLPEGNTEAVACHNIVYTLYAHEDDDEDKFSFEYVNLDTMEMKFIFEFQSHDYLYPAGEVIKVLKLFSLYYHELVVHNTMVNNW